MPMQPFEEMPQPQIWHTYGETKNSITIITVRKLVSLEWNAMNPFKDSSYLKLSRLCSYTQFQSLSLCYAPKQLPNKAPKGKILLSISS